MDDDYTYPDAYWRMMDGDNSEMQVNYDGKPTHGTLWDAAFDHVKILREKRHGTPKRDDVRETFHALGMVRAQVKLIALSNPKNPRCVRFVKQHPPFVTEHIERHKREIDACGRAVLHAYANDDVKFFDELARLAKIELGSRRKKTVTNEEVIIDIAIDLWWEWNENPSRESVKCAAEKAGVKIRPKDWPSYFKRCKLDFLISSKGAGRPPKPEPPERFVIEMPKGNFTIHWVTQSEGFRLQQEAEYKMRFMDKSDGNGDDDIPF